MIPATEKYVKNEYLSKESQSVRIDNVFQKQLVHTAKKVLQKQRLGIKLIFPDVLAIEKALKLQNQ